MHHLNPEGKMEGKKKKSKVQPILSFIHAARCSCEIQFQSCICNLKENLITQYSEQKQGTS